ncbi:MAG: hypothetical protein WD969_03730, partial [Paracoccaceae bacterium]
ETTSVAPDAAMASAATATKVMNFAGDIGILPWSRRFYFPSAAASAERRSGDGLRLIVATRI